MSGQLIDKIMNKKILKVWNFWIDGMLYHDQYLDQYMSVKGIKTYFCCPNFAPDIYKNYSAKSNYFAGQYNLLWLDYFKFMGKPVTLNIFQMIRYIIKIKPDLIHIFGISNFTTVLTFAAIFLSRYKGEIYINDHSDPTYRNKTILGKAYLQFFRLFFMIVRYKVKSIIVPDIASQNELLSRYGHKISSQLKIIPLGYDSKTFNFSPNFRKPSGNRLNIGFAGKINQAKRLDVLLDCLDGIEPSLISLEIAGFRDVDISTYEAELIERAKVSKHRITCSKFIQTPKELADFYRLKDLIIFPGSISITTLEATGVGTPIILYSSYEGLEHRVSGGRGNLFETNSELTDLIRFYIADRTKIRFQREEIANQSLQWSWEKITLQYLDCYGWNVS